MKFHPQKVIVLRRKVPIKELPKSLQDFISKYPIIWESYTKLGEACSKAGPLEDKYVELIKLAIWGTRIQYTPFKTHVRLALRSGATPEEIKHAIIQLLTAEGLSTTTIAMNWANEVIEDDYKKKRR